MEHNPNTINDEDLITKTWNAALAKQTSTGELTPMERTVVVLCAADGILGNGGTAYFFENDFEDGTPHLDIIAAYARIGATKTADILRRGLECFKGGDKPPMELRQKCLREFDEMGESSPLEALDKELFSVKEDEFRKLAELIRREQS